MMSHAVKVSYLKWKIISKTMFDGKNDKIQDVITQIVSPTTRILIRNTFNSTDEQVKL